MAFSYGFFNAQNLDRVYTAEDFTSYLSSLICNGILDTYQQCFTPSVNGTSITFGAGKAWIDGHYFVSDTSHAIDLSSYVDESLNRYVAIGIYCDRSARTCGIRVLAGTAATSPTIPTFQNTNASTYLTLAVVKLRAGTAAITDADLTDCREDSSLCGYCKCILGKCKVSEILSSLAQYNATVTELNRKISIQQTQIADMQAKLKDFTSDMVAAGQCGEDVYYIKYADGSLLLRGTGATYDYALNGNDSVFKYDENIRSVAVSNGITKIGDYLFFRCENVQSIVLPATLTEIGSNVIAQNDAIVGAVAGSLTSLVIPSRVTTIGEKAFRHNAFTELIIPASVTNWGDYAFADCAKLETVRVESSIMGSFAFPGCSSLSTLVISSNVKKFGSNMFTYCSSLEIITYEGTIVQWNAIEKPTNWMSSSGENHLWNGYLQKIQCIDGYLEYDAVNCNWNETCK